MTILDFIIQIILFELANMAMLKFVNFNLDYYIMEGLYNYFILVN